MKSKKYLWLLLLIPFLFVGIPVLQILLTPEEEVEIEEGAPVRVGSMSAGTVAQEIRYSGNLLPERTVSVVPKVAGRVEELLVDEGDILDQDELICVIDDEVVRLQQQQAYSAWQAAEAQYQSALRGVREEELENARNSLEQAESEFQLAQTNFERSQRLFEAGTISRSRFEEAESQLNAAETELENARRNIELMEEGASQEELEMARANADAAQRQYEIASLQVENTRITAPVGGVVAQVMVDEGNTVGLSTGIIAIVQDDPIIARIPIPERYYGDFLLYEGSIDVLISAIAYPHADSFSGTIHQLPAVINAENRTFGVEIAVENESRLLRPGMYVTAEFRMNIIDNARMLPADAVLNRAGGEVVFTLTEGNSFHANMIEVETGIVQGDMVQVLSGVDMDDIVIVEGNSFLEDGQLVRVVE